MALRVVVPMVILIQMICADSGCDPSCSDLYWNCDPESLGLESIEADEVIDCLQDYYKMRCPQFCKMCSACQYVSQAQMDRFQQQVDQLTNES